MRYVKFTSIVLLVLGLCYSSLWIGFTKGMSYQQSHDLYGAMLNIIYISEIKNGNSDKAIRMLENDIDSRLISYMYSDKTFIKYIYPLNQLTPDPVTTNQEVIDKISIHRKSSEHKCTIDKLTCDEIEKSFGDKKLP